MSFKQLGLVKITSGFGGCPSHQSSSLLFFSFSSHVPVPTPNIWNSVWDRSSELRFNKTCSSRSVKLLALCDGVPTPACYLVKMRPCGCRRGLAEGCEPPCRSKTGPADLRGSFASDRGTKRPFSEEFFYFAFTREILQAAVSDGAECNAGRPLCFAALRPLCFPLHIGPSNVGLLVNSLKIAVPCH